MEKESARKMACWMAQVAQEYNQPVLLIVEAFNSAIRRCQDIEVAKLQVIAKFENRKVGI